MRQIRIHVEAALVPGAEFPLPTQAAEHVGRVLRLVAGDPLTLFNGDGNDYEARLASAGKRGAEADIVAAYPIDNESPLRIVLLQGIARGEKMDWILQKATELGVAAFVPVSSERSEVKLDAGRAEKRAAHWYSVVIAACEQSGRARIPTIESPQSLDDALLALPRDSLRLMLDPGARTTVAGLDPPATRDAIIAIGPEGGWSPGDRAFLQAAGFNGLRLGPRILRTETAGIAAIAALQACVGDFAA
jgi:16S rRNA (uracil1498-N3)-methyltransferase